MYFIKNGKKEKYIPKPVHSYPKRGSPEPKRKFCSDSTKRKL